jgi:cytochrome c5
MKTYQNMGAKMRLKTGSTQEFAQKTMRTCLLVLGVVVAMSLSACGEDAPDVGAEDRAQIEERAQSLMPDDPDLAEIYEYSCYSCHANPETGAPLAGDKTSWAPRIAKGMEVLLDNTINGFQGMPPLGMCMDCSEDQFRDLIVFMSASRETSQ